MSNSEDLKIARVLMVVDALAAFLLRVVVVGSLSVALAPRACNPRIEHTRPWVGSGRSVQSSESVALKVPLVN